MQRASISLRNLGLIVLCTDTVECLCVVTPSTKHKKNCREEVRQKDVLIMHQSKQIEMRRAGIAAILALAFAAALFGASTPTYADQSEDYSDGSEDYSE